MELSNKTTILLPSDLRERLSRLAAQKGVSLAAVRSLAALELPVGGTVEMKLESVPDPEELLR